tara:strand:- start:1959 stop:2234 length:276 start_codon:yes stop_codon:yes gene_type:complete
MNLFVEAIICGLVILIIGSIVGFVLSKLTVSDLPPVCKDWNKNFIMEISLFLTGFFAFLLTRSLGISKGITKSASKPVEVYMKGVKNMFLK